MTRACEWPGCEKLGALRSDRPGARRKWCQMHAYRRKNGLDMDAPPGRRKTKKQPWPERFWEKVDRRADDECWRWLASLNDGGYGQIAIDGRPHRAHRVAYELLRGAIPDGMVLDHLCRNRWCANPWHLEIVTNEENIRRGHWGEVYPEPATHCPSGHEYSDGNVRLAKDGTRRCRTCERRDSLASYYRNRAGNNRRERAECMHCSRDVAIHPNSRQFANHMTPPGGCRFECCRAGETCAGSLLTSSEASRPIADRSNLRKWIRETPKRTE